MDGAEAGSKNAWVGAGEEEEESRTRRRRREEAEEEHEEEGEARRLLLFIVWLLELLGSMLPACCVVVRVGRRVSAMAGAVCTKLNICTGMRGMLRSQLWS